MITLLRKFLLHPNPELRARFKTILDELAPAEYKNNSESEILENFSDLEKNEGVERLKWQFNHSNETIKKKSIEMLGYLRNSNASPFVIEALLSGPEIIGDEICRALNLINPNQFPTNIHYPELFQYFTEIDRKILISKAEKQLFQPEEEDRIKSIHILYDLADPSTVNAMMVALTDHKDSIRMIAVKALVKIQAKTAIIPLLDCMIYSANPIMEGEIFKAIADLDPIRFAGKTTLVSVIERLTGVESENLLQRMINRFEITDNELRKISLIKLFAQFNDIRVLELLIQNLQNQTREIQRSAGQSLHQILERPKEKGISQTDQINLVLQALENNGFFTQFDIQNFLQHFSWREILKAIIYHPITDNSRLRQVLQGWGRSIHIRLLYELRKLSNLAIFEKFLSTTPVTEQINNTYVAFLSLSYPNSYEELVKFYKANRHKMSEEKIHQMDTLIYDLLEEFRGREDNIISGFML